MNSIQKYTDSFFEHIKILINKAQPRTAIFVNREATLLYWSIGDFINAEIREKQLDTYGSGILATLSQHLSWSHLIESVSMDDELKRKFYTELAIDQRWGVRELRRQTDTMLFERTALAAKPEQVIQQQLDELAGKNKVTPELVFKNTYILDFLNLPQTYTESELENTIISNLQQFIMELGSGFTFVERQKRISVDSIDYRLDLLFFHRKLKRLIAIDLKIGRFIPAYKAQMELYLRWLQKYEKQAWEENPIGLLLCSEGNTEHIELLMLDNDQIRVAQYLTELPDKQWFADKLHRAIEITRQKISDDNEK